MTDLRKAAEMALESLKWATEFMTEQKGLEAYQAMDALEQALAQPDEVLAEREACAKVCEEISDSANALWKVGADPTEQGREIGAEHCAQAIRARGKE